jgi:hypothetical protein
MVELQREGVLAEYWAEYMQFRNALSEGRDVPLTHAEIRWMTEVVIRSHATNFMTPEDERLKKSCVV